MKYVIFAIAALAVIHQVVGQEEDAIAQKVELELFRDALKQQMALQAAAQKMEAICPGRREEVKGALLKVVECSERAEKNNETMCTTVRNHLKPCFAPLSELFEDCLPEQGKDIPSLVVDVLIKTTNHLCKEDGEHIFELGNSCIKKVNSRTARCLRRITTRVQAVTRGQKILSAEALCEFAAELRPCLQSHLNSACANQITRDSWLGLYDEALLVCKSYENNVIDAELINIKQTK